MDLRVFVSSSHMFIINDVLASKQTELQRFNIQMEPLHLVGPNQLVRCMQFGLWSWRHLQLQLPPVYTLDILCFMAIYHRVQIYSRSLGLQSMLLDHRFALHGCLLPCANSLDLARTIILCIPYRDSNLRSTVTKISSKIEKTISEPSWLECPILRCDSVDNWLALKISATTAWFFSKFLVFFWVWVLFRTLVQPS